MFLFQLGFSSIRGKIIDIEELEPSSNVFSLRSSRSRCHFVQELAALVIKRNRILSKCAPLLDLPFLSLLWRILFHPLGNLPIA